MVEKIRPKTDIIDRSDMDGRRTWKEIVYYCPTCMKRIKAYKSDVACVECGTFFDWGEREPKIRTTYSVVW